MRIDVVTIFAEYLAPLELSLIGKARRSGLLDVRVTDLRDYAHDRHRTVDDTPYGGGAGMVMKPEPWGEALDAVLADQVPGGPRPHLIVPGPGGAPFTQQRAHELAEQDWLVFACGRYEGIDERVYDAASEQFEQVSIISLGDYVLNGGEVAALAMIEAVGRLLPGVVGNAESLVEESHEGGLLEYPVYTKPASWRGRAVPPVLLGGDHAAIARWRREQRRERTARRRPDLLSASEVDDVALRLATPADAAELHVLTRACWAGEVRSDGSFDGGPLAENLDELRDSMSQWRTWVGVAGGRIVASVRARMSPESDVADWQVDRLMVAPDRRGAGLARRLLMHVEQQAPPQAEAYELLTGSASTRNLRLYRKAGYRLHRSGTAAPGAGDILAMRKTRR